MNQFMRDLEEAIDKGEGMRECPCCEEMARELADLAEGDEKYYWCNSCSCIFIAIHDEVEIIGFTNDPYGGIRGLI